MNTKHRLFAAAILLSLVLGLTIHAQKQTATRAWDYYVDAFNSRGEASTKLNELGNQGWERLTAMVGLVDEIESSAYGNRLFAWTSMHDLCIVQTAVTYPYDGPYLRISPRANGRVEFRYVDTPIANKQWHRTVDGKDAFTRLQSFVEQLHWFA